MVIANVEMAAAWDGAEGEHWAAHTPTATRPPHLATGGRCSLRFPSTMTPRSSTSAAAPVVRRGTWPASRHQVRSSCRPVRDAGARTHGGERRGADQRALRAGGRPGSSVPSGRIRSGPQRVRRDVLRRARGGVRQHRPSAASGRGPGAAGLERGGAQRVGGGGPRGPVSGPGVAHTSGGGARTLRPGGPIVHAARPHRGWVRGRRASTRSRSRSGSETTPTTPSRSSRRWASPEA